MKLMLTVATVLTVAVLQTGAQSPAVTYVDHDKVAAALAKGGSLVTAPNVTFSGAQRTGPGAGRSAQQGDRRSLRHGW